jgi:transposase
MNKKRIYKSYPQEFKEEAVAIVIEQDYSVQKRPNQFYGWRKKLEGSQQGFSLSINEREVLRQFHKDNKLYVLRKKY